MLKDKDMKLIPVNRYTDVMDLLVLRRRRLYPNVKINEISEPLYDHLLTDDMDVDPMFTVIKTHQTVVSKGLKTMKAPVFGNEALYKGEMI